MMRKIAIALFAAAIATAGSTLSAPAMHGGGGGGARAGGPAHVSGGGYGRPSAGRAYGMGPRAYAFHGRGLERRYDYRRPYRYGYRKYPYRYGYYKTYPSYGGSCWTRVWTPDGWRSKYVCGYERPSYGYRYGYRPYYRYGYGRPYGGYRYGGYGGHYRPSYGRR